MWQRHYIIEILLLISATETTGDMCPTGICRTPGAICNSVSMECVCDCGSFYIDETRPGLSVATNTRVCAIGKFWQQETSTKFDKYRISNEFSFQTMYYETSCVFYIPEPLAYSVYFFCESGTDDTGTSYALKRKRKRSDSVLWQKPLHKFAWCSVFTIRGRSRFIFVEIKNTTKNMFWYDNKSKFAVWWTCVHSRTRSDTLPTRKRCFSHAQIFM